MIALLPAALLPAAAEDEEKPHWFGATYDNMTVLAYGIPDSDYVMLSFSCAVGKPVVNVNVQDEESSAEEGALMHVRLSVGGKKIEFSEKAILNERSEEHTSELQSLMRISYAVFCLKKKKNKKVNTRERGNRQKTKT